MHSINQHRSSVCLETLPKGPCCRTMKIAEIWVSPQIIFNESLSSPWRQDPLPLLLFSIMVERCNCGGTLYSFPSSKCLPLTKIISWSESGRERRWGLSEMRRSRCFVCFVSLNLALWFFFSLFFFGQRKLKGQSSLWLRHSSVIHFLAVLICKWKIIVSAFTQGKNLHSKV